MSAMLLHRSEVSRWATHVILARSPECLLMPRQRQNSRHPQTAAWGQKAIMQVPFVEFVPIQIAFGVAPKLVALMPNSRMRSAEVYKIPNKFIRSSKTRFIFVS
jgi:hypothetical protein